ncbi:tetratricopeptide repeat protein [Acrocarpospora pleiomorpha]|nr:tetratricopeptide repeat protein [Acrocarpospora pleiomorpha]
MTAISAASRPRRGPFIGPRPFDARDGMLFFGRTGEISELTRMWQGNRLTILHSDAGTGKTSLLRAGVVPELRSWNTRVLPIGQATLPPVWPTAALSDHNPYVFALLSSWTIDQSPVRVAGLSVDDFLRKELGIDKYGQPAPTLAAVDQAETFLRESAGHEYHRCRFLDELFEALMQRSNLRLLLSVRTDYLDQLLRIVKGFGGLPYAEFALQPFKLDDAANIVRKSVEATSGGMVPDRVNEMLDELSKVRDGAGKERERTFTIDPQLLQVAGIRLWGDPAAQGHLADTRPEVAVDQALRDFCTRTLAEIAADHELSPDSFNGWLRQAILTIDGMGPSSSAGVTAAVVHSLEDRHLFRTPQQEGLRVHEPRQPQLLGPLLWASTAPWPAVPPDPADRLHAAVQALSDGEPDRARRLAIGAASACPPQATRTRAEIESLFGNIAYEQDLLNQAIAYYRAAARIFEAIGDSTAVGWLLVAVGRIALKQGRESSAIEDLRAAVNRAPHDLIVQTVLGQALWQAGESQAALAVLNGVLDRQGDTPEARRTRGEILADLGNAELALRDIRQLRSHRIGSSTRAAHALALATLALTDVAVRELDDVLTEGEDSGPVLLRAARVRKLAGDGDEAARLAERAILALHPPLPIHQRRAAVHLLEDP